MRRGVFLAAAVALAGPLGLAGGGGSNPVTLSVGLQVPASCTVSGATLQFGASNGEPMAAQTAVAVECNEGQAWQLSAAAGNHYQGSTRRMHDGAGNFTDSLLFTDEAMVVEMGDAETGGSYPAGVEINGLGTGAVQSVSLFGLVPAFPSGLPAGQYADEVLLTLSF